MRAALRAEYGVDLREVMEHRTMPVDDLVDMVQWLPAGCALWRDFGGPASLTAEQGELRRVLFMLRVLDYRERGSKGEKPKPEPHPPYAHEKRAEQDVMSRKASAYLRRQRHV